MYLCVCVCVCVCMGGISLKSVNIKGWVDFFLVMYEKKSLLLQGLFYKVRARV